MSRLTIPFTDLEFDPSITLDSGQAFRWSPVDESRQVWIGIVSDALVRVTKNEAKVLGAVDKSFDSESIRRYFSLEDDLGSIFSTFPSDETLDSALEKFRGLRLLKQDPWECLISFVCSINCNIPSIRLKIANLSRRYGRRIDTDLDLKAYSFPTATTLARASKRDLLECRLGFRWRYVKFIAKKVVEGHLDLERLSTVPYRDAFPELISDVSGKTFGVGPKVADCTLLYSLHKMEAFPIDVWILRCLRKFYHDEIEMKNLESLTLKKYLAVSESMRKKFGNYAGYAQLYLYVKMRSDSNHSI
ncbi:MAG TPA: DNA glycosylase [Nitrososphaerales archaeon]|nr:DNA glycosylase [Nitrososphaerales archaeon]